MSGFKKKSAKRFINTLFNINLCSLDVSASAVDWEVKEYFLANLEDNSSVKSISISIKKNSILEAIKKSIKECKNVKQWVLRIDEFKTADQEDVSA